MGIIAATSLHAVTVFQVLFLWTDIKKKQNNKNNKTNP